MRIGGVSRQNPWVVVHHPSVVLCVLLRMTCRWPDLQEGVLTAPDCVMVLSERLQMFRDTEVR